jgi:hypothetical protein
MLIEELSDRVLRSLSTTVWRKLFLEPRESVMHFEQEPATLLCAELHAPSWSAGAHLLSELAYLARRHGGEVDPCPPTAALVRFSNPAAALEMAWQMQQLASDAPFQIGIVTGPCTTASFRLDGGVLRVLAGAEVGRAAAVAALAAAGTIRLDGATYHGLQQEIGGITSGVISTEYEGDEVTAVSLTLPPSSTAYLSTFAGLGLT